MPISIFYGILLITLHHIKELSMFNFSLLSMIAALPAIIIAMAMHEYAHAKVADILGDDTPHGPTHHEPIRPY